MVQKRTAWVLKLAACCLPVLLCSACAWKDVCRVRSVTYNGWSCTELTNGRVDVVVAPQLGGRIVQLRLGNFEYLWVNKDLAGKVVNPRAGRPGKSIQWANYGGDKLWPAPQGWSGSDEWPGPPDPIDKGGRTDSGPFQLEVLSSGSSEAAVRMTGPDDLYAGIRFIREIRLRPHSTTVELKSTMVNVVGRPVRWGIWQVTQHDALVEDLGTWSNKNPDLQAWAPINPRSKYPRGYRVLFGPEENPQFQVNEVQLEGNPRKIFRLSYQHRVGKVGLDTSLGWLAVTHRKSSHLFAHTFPAKSDLQHPDGASVEFWASGPGWIQLGDQPLELKESEPWLIESEVLSPYAELGPGQSYSQTSKIHLARGRGPVVEVTGATAVLKPLRQVEGGILAGRIAVFHNGKLEFKSLTAENESPIFLGLVEAGEVIDLGENPWARRMGKSKAGTSVAVLQLVTPDGKTLASLPIGNPGD